MYTIHFAEIGVPDLARGFAVDVLPNCFQVENLDDDSKERIQKFPRTKDGWEALADHIYDENPDADIYLIGEESWSHAAFFSEAIKQHPGIYIQVDVLGLAHMVNHYMKRFPRHHLKLWLPNEGSPGWAHSVTKIADLTMVLLFEYKWGPPVAGRVRDGSGGPGDVVRFYAYSNSDTKVLARVDEQAYSTPSQIWD